MTRKEEGKKQQDAPVQPHSLPSVIKVCAFQNAEQLPPVASLEDEANSEKDCLVTVTEMSRLKLAEGA